MFFKNKLERLLERICVIVLCVITAVMAIPVKSVTAAGSASVVLEILHEWDTVNVKLEMVSNPGIAGMSFKLCYDSSLLSIVSVDETLDSFKSSIINPDGDGFVGYAYAQAKTALENGSGVAWANDNTEVIAYANQNSDFVVGIPELGSADTIAPAVTKGNDTLLNWINDEIKALGKENFFHKDYEATLLDTYGKDYENQLVIEGGELASSTNDTAK